MKEKKASVVETELWVQLDKVTGEHIGEAKEIDVVMKPVDRNGFMITYVTAIIQMLDKVGNQKMKVVKYILENMDISNNMLAKTIREIVNETKISKQTVIETLKMLEEANIITRKTGVIMLSPKLIHRGDFKKERILMTKFQEIQAAKNQTAKIDFPPIIPQNVVSLDVG